MTQFSDFQLPEAIAQALADLDFTIPTDIQKQAIPMVLKGRDLMACAQTGSGKTAAYCLPMLVRLIENPEANALILAPTRELARQIADVVGQLTAHTKNMPRTVLVGGAEIKRQCKSLQKKPRIIIATPGRLRDHMKRKPGILAKTQFLVLDEGDRMLDMGFAPQLDAILKFLPKERQTLLFTATLPKKVRALAESYLSNPQQLTIGQDSQPVESIRQTAIEVKGSKDDVLLDELNRRQGSVIVFTKTKAKTNQVAHYLHEYGFKVSKMHSDCSQGQRNIALKGFRDGKFRILVATDVAARGIDVPHIQHVINYDLPMFAEDYVHRIGRTARAGASGEAVSLLMPEDRYRWLKIAKRYKIAGVDTSALADRGPRGDHSRPRKPGGPRKKKSAFGFAKPARRGHEGGGKFSGRKHAR